MNVNNQHFVTETRESAKRGAREALISAAIPFVAVWQLFRMAAAQLHSEPTRKHHGSPSRT